MIGALRACHAVPLGAVTERAAWGQSCVKAKSPAGPSRVHCRMKRGMGAWLGLLCVYVCVPLSAAESASMPENNHAQVRAANALLDLQLSYDAAHALLVADYRLRNEGKQAIAAFDRGDSIALATRRLVAGKNVAPMLEQGGVRVTLSHFALDLPNPAPTVPRVSLAARIEPGETLSGSFRIEMPSDARDVRYCIGVATFDDEHFSAAATPAGVALWRTAFTVAALQSRVCSPWFSLADGRFEQG